MADLPNDADGDALRRLLDHGSDLAKPMDIDFHVAAPDETSCRAIAEAAVQAGYATESVRDEEDGQWTCWCTKTMVPRYDDLIASQELLNALGGRHGGYIDGWGSFGNAPK